MIVWSGSIAYCNCRPPTLSLDQVDALFPEDPCPFENPSGGVELSCEAYDACKSVFLTFEFQGLPGRIDSLKMSSCLSSAA